MGLLLVAVVAKVAEAGELHNFSSLSCQADDMDPTTCPSLAIYLMSGFTLVLSSLGLLITVVTYISGTPFV